MIGPNEYNLRLAIEARRALMFEATAYEECVKRVYEPTLQLLSLALLANPREIICLRGPIVSPKESRGSYCDLDFVGPENQVAYLGTVRDRFQAFENWEWFLKINRNFPEVSTLLAMRGVQAIIRHRIRCDIPVEAVKLDESAMEEGLRKFVKTFLPDFDWFNLEIKWLEPKLQSQLERKIKYEAKKISKPQTEAEKKKVFGNDTF